MTNTDVYTLVVSGTYLFAGTGSGVYFTTDNGKSWTGTGLPELPVRSLIVSGGYLFAGTGS